MNLSGSPLDFIIAFGAGAAVSFSPCVYPLIPVTVGYIGANSQGSRLKALWVSLLYSLGIATTYSALGVVAVLTGTIFGQITSNFWAYFILGNFYLLFGLLLLDVFNLPFFNIGIKNVRPRSMLSVFLFGLVSGLAVGPCTFPVLGAILVHVASRQNILYGVSLLFAFSYGVCFLLILTGVFSGLLANLPKSGEWLTRIKKAGGIILLCMAEYFLIQAGGFIYD